MAARRASGLKDPEEGVFIFMFTGIIEQQGIVQKKTAGRLHVRAGSAFVKQLSRGASVAVNGACLTVSDIPAKTVFAADVMPETLRRTTLGSLKRGSPVNLELPLKAGGRFGGHIVQGHIDGTAKILDIQKEKNSRIITFEIPEGLSRYVVEKGSIIVNGVALSVIKSDGKTCTVGIIPHTWKQTTFRCLSKGDLINIETDILAKYVVRRLQNYEK